MDIIISLFIAIEQNWIHYTAC